MTFTFSINELFALPAFLLRSDDEEDDLDGDETEDNELSDDEDLEEDELSDDEEGSL